MRSRRFVCKILKVSGSSRGGRGGGGGGRGFPFIHSFIYLFKANKIKYVQISIAKS